MARYDDSDCCGRCGDLFTFEEIRHYREECNSDAEDEMPTYCQECLDQLHLYEGTPLDVDNEDWTKNQWWVPRPGG